MKCTKAEHNIPCGRVKGIGHSHQVNEKNAMEIGIKKYFRKPLLINMVTRIIKPYTIISDHQHNFTLALFETNYNTVTNIL
jgi:hypothetical protein